METWLGLARSGELGRALSLKDRSLILTRGDPATQVFLLASGSWEVFQESDEGNSVVVKVVTAPSIGGSPEVVAGDPEYLETIRIAGAATVFRLEARAYLEILQRNVNATVESLVDISQCFTGAARFESSRLHDAETVLATLMCAYVEAFGRRNGDDIVIGLRRSQQALAAAVGCTERSVNKILSSWKGRRWMSKRAGQYVVHQLGALEKQSGALKGSLLQRWRAPAHLKRRR